MKKNYFIDGENQIFNSLDEVRNHIWMQSDNDKQEYNGMVVLCDADDTFGRTIVIKGNKVILSIK